jgi:magnesium chelatase family protein
LDRIDLHVALQPVEVGDLFRRSPGEPSARVRGRVEEARERQNLRYADEDYRCNAELDGHGARAASQLTEAGSRLLREAVGSLALSGRGHDRILKVARTIADLDGSTKVDAMHLAEALSFRVRSP